jgi:DNA-binding GntR family transcriptional regulator
VRIQILDAITNTAHRPYNQSDITDMEKLHASAQNLKRYRDLQEYWRINNQINEILGRIIDNTVLKSIHNSLYYQTARSWFQYVEKMWDENIDMLESEIKEEIRPMKIGDTRGTLMARRTYILLFLSIMDRYRSLHETPGGP